MAKTHGGPRRKTQWGGFGSNTGTAAIPEFVDLAAGTAVILSSNIVKGATVGVNDEEFTVTRTIGRFSFSIDVTTAAAAASVAVGCAVVRNEVVAGGVGVLPSPEDSPDFEWLYYGVYHMVNPGSSLADGPLSSGFVDFDVRGQRIVRNGQTLVWLAEAQGNAARGAVGGRYLVKLT